MNIDFPAKVSVAEAPIARTETAAPQTQVGLKPLQYAADRLGCSVSKIKRLIKEDPTFSAIKVGAGPCSHWRIDPERLEPWIDALRRKPIDDFRQSVQGRGGVFTVPVNKIENATHNLRSIALTGREPADGWDRAAELQSCLPDDLATAFNVPLGSPWSAAVRKARILIALDVREQVIALRFIQERFNARHRDPLGDDS